MLSVTAAHTTPAVAITGTQARASTVMIRLPPGRFFIVNFDSFRTDGRIRRTVRATNRR
jgi:hypothetical protein